ncbi:hypothetical protein [Acidipila sp. EB88]|uniref:hypothetical protein n=1 Tax=Acidipila sp. EB88 TaxID=2305226 RepID=UPI000F5DF927|nr:hypothetical protein [Acidipila sp. EB88]RRA48190.1 hypothetical protein D1Y84_07735 [Acidipila sp. EB88]
MRKLTSTLLLSLVAACTTAYGQNNANPAVPGTLNYVEGQVSIDGQAMSQRSVGQANVETGQLLETGNGKAEMLLTPGVFLRLDNNSAVKMVSPSLTNTVVELDHGRADVEVDQLYKQNHIAINQDGEQSLLVKGGLYEFDARSHKLRVFDGKAAVFQNAGSSGGPSDAEKAVVVKGGRELTLGAEDLKTVSFDKKQSQDELYNWSSLRSEYLGEANASLAANYAGVDGFAGGWLWSSGLYGYTWLPGEGAFLSPFGYGFYSPYYLYGGGGYFGRGGYGYGRVGARSGYASGAVRSGSLGAGLHGSAGGFHGGGGGGGGHR